MDLEIVSSPGNESYWVFMDHKIVLQNVMVFSLGSLRGPNLITGLNLYRLEVIFLAHLNPNKSPRTGVALTTEFPPHPKRPSAVAKTSGSSVVLLNSTAVCACVDW